MRSRSTTPTTAARRASCATGCSTAAPRRGSSTTSRIPYVAPDPHVVSDEQQKIDDETRELMTALLDGVPLEREDRDARRAGPVAPRPAARLPPARAARRVVALLHALRSWTTSSCSTTSRRSAGWSLIGEPEVVTNQGATAQWFSFPAAGLQVRPGRRDRSGDQGGRRRGARDRRRRTAPAAQAHEEAPRRTAAAGDLPLHDLPRQRAPASAARPRPRRPRRTASTGQARCTPRGGSSSEERHASRASPRRAALHGRAVRRGDAGRRAAARRVAPLRPGAARVGQDVRRRAR